MATAKRMFYNPPLALLPKRKDTHTHIPTPTPTTTTTHHHHHPQRGGPTLTVTIPFAFSTRLSRLDHKRQGSAASIRRSKPSNPKTTTTPRTTSLPRLAQTSARPSNTTSGSTATRSASDARRASSGCELSSQSAAEDVAVRVLGQYHHQQEEEEEVEVEEQEVLSPEEEEERKLNSEKCQKWLQGLPEKFSSMHVVQHVVYYSGSSKPSVEGQCMFLP